MLNKINMTTLEVELEKCTQFLQNLDPQSFSLEEALGSIERLIDSLERYIHDHKAQTPRELTEKISLVGQRLTLLGERFVNATGMHEEELLALFDSPKPFSKDKWELAHATEQHLLRVAKSIVSHIGEPPPESHAHKDHPKHLHQPPRSKWMKS